MTTLRSLICVSTVAVLGMSALSPATVSSSGTFQEPMLWDFVFRYDLAEDGTVSFTPVGAVNQVWACEEGYNRANHTGAVGSTASYLEVRGYGGSGFVNLRLVKQGGGFRHTEDFACPGQLATYTTAVLGTENSHWVVGHDLPWQMAPHDARAGPFHVGARVCYKLELKPAQMNDFVRSGKIPFTGGISGEVKTYWTTPWSTVQPYYYRSSFWIAGTGPWRLMSNDGVTGINPHCEVVEEATWTSFELNYHVMWPDPAIDLPNIWRGSPDAPQFAGVGNWKATLSLCNTNCW